MKIYQDISYLHLQFDNVKNSFLLILLKCPRNEEKQQLHEVRGKQHQMPTRSSMDFRCKIDNIHKQLVHIMSI